MSVTQEYLEIRALEDVEAIDPATDNRYAVRSLRHAADRAITEAKRALRTIRAIDNGTYSVPEADVLDVPSIRCAASNAADWRARLLEAKAALTAEPAAPQSLEELRADLQDKANEQKGLALACLDKAVAILDAHPDGLQASASAPVSADEDEDDDEEYDEDED